MNVELDDVVQERKWQIGPDLCEECNAVASLPEIDPGDW